MDPQWIQTRHFKGREATREFLDAAAEEDATMPETPLTCEQRRAIEYGIDEADLPDPRPNGRDWNCPIAFGCAYAEWKARQR